MENSSTFPSSHPIRPGFVRRVLVWLLVICMICPPALAQREDAAPDNLEPLDLPEIADSAGALISPEQEKALGKEFMRQLRRQAPIIDDEEVKEYVENLGNSLAQHAGYYGDFTFFTVNSPVINAFAVPGGYIGIHSGLILNSRNESEVASVIAHEISHITQRHSVRMIEARGRTSILSMAALLGAVAIAAMNPRAGAAAITGVQAASAQAQINFTRANEHEADRIGIQLLHQAGYDTHAMAAFFERLQRANRYSDPKHIPEFLRTHPVTVNRVAEARDRALQLADTTPRDNSFDYYLIWTKLNVTSAVDPAHAKAFYANALQEGSYVHETAARYGYVLALTEAGDFDRARVELGKLLLENPNIRAFLLAGARLEEKAGDYDRALKYYATAHELYPDSRATTYDYARLLSNTGNPEQSRTMLRARDLREREDPKFHAILAEAETQLGDRGATHFALSDYYRTVGELQLASEQLRLAQAVPDISNYQRLRIDARLEEIQSEIARREQSR